MASNQKPAETRIWRSGPVNREKSETLFLIVTCALIMAPHSAHLPLWITQVCVALLGWRAWITLRGDRLPPRWLLLPVCGIVMAGVLLTHETLLGRDTGVAMLVLLVAFKLLEMHAKRDALVVVFLSFFLILMNFFYSQSILLTALMMFTVVLVMTAQLSFQFAETVPPLAERLRLGASVVGFAAPLMLVLFVLFPRFQGPFWGMPGDSRSGITGMSNSMAPGNISRLALSTEVALRARFVDAPPPAAKLYWRGPVLGRFDGRTWTPLLRPASATRPVSLNSFSKPARYQVTLEPNNQNSLFVLEMPVAAPVVTGNSVRVTSDMQLVTAEPIQQRLRYDAASYLDFRFEGNETPVSLRDWVALPPGFNPRTLQFAADLLGETTDSTQLVNRVLQEFRQKNFRYTLTPPALGDNSVDDFLFNTRSGFCEHFASAFVVLMRALDIPARVVTGYQGGEFNSIDNFLTVRQSDAHAWAEVWLGTGWVRVDPTAAVAPERVESSFRSTPAQGLLSGLGFATGNDVWPGLAQRLRLNWDAINNRWNQLVLDYSVKGQRSLLKSLGFNDPDWRTAAMLMLLCASLVMAVIGVTLLRNRRQKDPVELLFSQFCESLARHGEVHPLHEGPRAWRDRLMKKSLPADRLRTWCRFLEEYESLRYARADASAASSQRLAAARLKQLLSQCR